MKSWLKYKPSVFLVSWPTPEQASSSGTVDKGRMLDVTVYLSSISTVSTSSARNLRYRSQLCRRSRSSSGVRSRSCGALL